MLNLNTSKPLSKTRVVVAMSGGVDSSTVAALVKEAGYDAIGITLQLYDQAETLKRKGACCAGQDIYDAKMAADKIGIPHYVLDYESKFKESVIDDFADTYLQGQTPLPCVKCNQTVKFNDLLKFAKDLEADALVTGHYVQKISALSRSELHKAFDLSKDQSYFLFATTKTQLDFLHFPLGGISKEETRKHAKRFNLDVSDKPDSQDICFVAGGDYREVVKKLRPDSIIKGDIYHIEGYKIGEHEGIINYTIGQRKGIKVNSKDALYVVKIDPASNIVYVGPETELFAHEFIVNDFNWLGDTNYFNSTLEVEVKIRSGHIGALAEVTPINEREVKVKLFSKQRAVTPGQACVMYDKTRVLGGGWITNSIL